MRISKENFENALEMALQCGKETVANLQRPSDATKKGLFAPILDAETRKDISLTVGVEIRDLTIMEWSSLVFAFNIGWNIELENQKRTSI